MTTEQFLTFVDKIVWPLFFIVIYLLNLKTFNRIFHAIAKRIESGAEVSFRVGQITFSLPSPQENEGVNENHLALLHSSWRYSKKDNEFGKTMYVIQVILQANKDVLDKVEFVRYSLHPSYPNKLQIKMNQENNFELKELAWGEFNLKADVKIKRQEELIKLTRYINLTETGENLLKR